MEDNLHIINYSRKEALQNIHLPLWQLRRYLVLTEKESSKILFTAYVRLRLNSDACYNKQA